MKISSIVVNCFEGGLNRFICVGMVKRSAELVKRCGIDKSHS